MNYRLIGNILGKILWVEAAFLLVPLAVSLLSRDGCAVAFAVSIALCAALGAVPLLFPIRRQRMQSIDGYVAVALSWLSLSVLGAVPYLLTGAIPRFADAVFETASGFTTTGATILSAVEHLPPSVLMWRSLTQWMGGMGVLVLFLALMPKTGDGAVFLMRAESPGPIKSKLVPKLSQTAKILYILYVGLTAAETLALRMVGVSWFDAVNHAFTTMATGGFSTHNGGVGDLGGAAVTWVITFFTLLAGVNFSMLYLVLKGRLGEVWRNQELRLYLILVVGYTAIITLSLVRQSGLPLGRSITDATFQVVTLITTTGYATADFALWPSLCQAILLLCMVSGGCAGSTAGGMKVSRIQLLGRSMRRELDKLAHPSRVSVISLDGQAVSERSITAAHAFAVAYFLMLLTGMLVVSVDNVGLLESLAASLTCISNVGPGLGALGPMSNFGGLSDMSKYVLSVLMLMGRLELMPILALMMRNTWRK